MGEVHRPELVALLLGRALVLALVATWLVGAVAPASASCAADAGPPGSQIIFVGTVEDQRGGYTRFSVAEVWVGPDLASEVWVLSGQEQPPFPLNLFSAVSSSVDADFVEGERYLVGASDDFSTNACTIQEMSTVTADLAPPDGVRQPTADGAEGADPPLSPVVQGLSVGAVVVLLVGSVVLWRRRPASR